jgi:hypothetical protein
MNASQAGAEWAPLPPGTLNGDAFLRSWLAWKDALDAYNFLASLDSPGAHVHWRIFWIAAVSALRATGHVLKSVDQPRMGRKAPIVDIWRDAAKHEPIFSEFIEQERNNVLKRYQFGTTPSKVTSYTMDDRGKSYKELVAKYGERTILVWGGDIEDSIEMLARSIIWWDIELRIVEQACSTDIVASEILNHRARHSLLQASLHARSWHADLPTI